MLACDLWSRGPQPPAAETRCRWALQPEYKYSVPRRPRFEQTNVLLICKFKAGASVDCLQAYAGGGSGLTKGEYCNKPYG